jgi:hypothetical protein
MKRLWMMIVLSLCLGCSTDQHRPLTPEELEASGALVLCTANAVSRAHAIGSDPNLAIIERCGSRERLQPWIELVREAHSLLINP